MGFKIEVVNGEKKERKILSRALLDNNGVI